MIKLYESSLVLFDLVLTSKNTQNRILGNKSGSLQNNSMITPFDLLMDVSIDGRSTIFNFFLSETSRDIKKMF